VQTTQTSGGRRDTGPGLVLSLPRGKVAGTGGWDGLSFLRSCQRGRRVLSCPLLLWSGKSGSLLVRTELGLGWANSTLRVCAGVARGLAKGEGAHGKSGLEGRTLDSKRVVWQWRQSAGGGKQHHTLNRAVADRDEKTKAGSPWRRRGPQWTVDTQASELDE
jgi:hypothetical protein